MLLASPVRIEAEDLDLEIDLPGGRGPDARAGAHRARGRRRWLALRRLRDRVPVPARGGPAAIDRMVTRAARPSRRGASGPRARSTPPCAATSGSTRSPSPARTESGFLVEIRRGAREGWRPGRSSPFYVVRGPAPARPSTPPASSCVATAEPSPAGLGAAAGPRRGRDARACLDSLAAQTLADHEVIAVDDGSRDGSGERPPRPRGSDPRLRAAHAAARARAAPPWRSPRPAPPSSRGWTPTTWRCRAPRAPGRAARAGPPRSTCSAAASPSPPRRAARPGRACAPTSSGRTPSSSTTRSPATASSSRRSSTPPWP